MAGEAYDKNLIIGAEHAYLAAYAIPFAVDRKQAEQAVNTLMYAFPEVFSDRSTVSDIGGMQAVFLPYWLCNVTMLAQVTTEKGSLLIHHGRLNWGSPLSVYHDRYLMNALHPWDFSDLSPFRPTLLEGEVQLVGYSRMETKEEQAQMLMRDMPQRIKEEFSVHEAQMDWVQHYVERHMHSQMMLPVWFLDRKPPGFHGKNEHTARFAVNGQTGKACCILDAGRKEERIIEAPAFQARRMSLDSTHYMTPAPVISEKKPGVYRHYLKPAEFDQALFKKKGLLGRIFG